MAYAAAMSYVESRVNGRRCVVVTVSETELAAASEYSLDLTGYCPSGSWRIVRLQVVKTAGAAATLAPVFSRTTAPAAGTAGYIGGIAAAAGHDSNNVQAGWLGTGTAFFMRTTPNAAADNSVTTRIVFADGPI